jgi:hypothetical protein
MSDAVALDLYIQDFVRTNRLLNQHLDWPSLVNRRLIEALPAGPRIFQFESAGHQHLAIATYMVLPDRDTLRVELTRTIPATEEHRFDYLRMMSVNTHISVESRLVGPTMIVSLRTRHRGLLNVDIVIRSPGESPEETEPLFCGR